jgi:hypothetical protein
MKKNINLALVFALVIVMLSSCQAIGDIFKAGVWVGIIVVVAVIGLIIFLVGKGKK